MENFNTKVNKAAAMFLNRRGYDILDEPWKRDGGMLPTSWPRTGTRSSS